MELVIILSVLVGIKLLIGLSPSLGKIWFKVAFILSFITLATGYTFFRLNISFVNLKLDITSGLIVITAFSFIIWNLPYMFYEKKIITYRQLFSISKLISIVSGPIFFILAFFILYVKPDKEIKLNNEFTYKERKFRKAILVPDLTVEITKKIDKYGLLEKHFIRKDYYTLLVGYNKLEVSFKDKTLYLETFLNERSVCKEKFKDSITIN